jgi:hypothetical protein
VGVADALGAVAYARRRRTFRRLSCLHPVIGIRNLSSMVATFHSESKIVHGNREKRQSNFRCQSVYTCIRKEKPHTPETSYPSQLISNLDQSTVSLHLHDRRPLHTETYVCSTSYQPSTHSTSNEFAQTLTLHEGLYLR